MSFYDYKGTKTYEECLEARALTANLEVSAKLLQGDKPELKAFRIGLMRKLGDFPSIAAQIRTHAGARKLPDARRAIVETQVVRDLFAMPSTPPRDAALMITRVNSPEAYENGKPMPAAAPAALRPDVPQPSSSHAAGPRPTARPTTGGSPFVPPGKPIQPEANPGSSGPSGSGASSSNSTGTSPTGAQTGGPNPTPRTPISAGPRPLPPTNVAPTSRSTMSKLFRAAAAVVAGAYFIHISVLKPGARYAWIAARAAGRMASPVGGLAWRRAGKPVLAKSGNWALGKTGNAVSHTSHVISNIWAPVAVGVAAVALTSHYDAFSHQLPEATILGEKFVTFADVALTALLVGKTFGKAPKEERPFAARAVYAVAAAFVFVSPALMLGRGLHAYAIGGMTAGFPASDPWAVGIPNQLPDPIRERLGVPKYQPLLDASAPSTVRPQPPSLRAPLWDFGPR